MKREENVSKGLGLLSISSIISIAVDIDLLFLTIIRSVPLAGLFFLLGIVGLLVEFIGLLRLCDQHRAYRNALIAWVIVVAAALFSKNAAPLGNLAQLVGTIGGFLAFYFIIAATNNLLKSESFEEQAAMGRRALKWRVINVAVGILAFLLGRALPPLELTLYQGELAVELVARVFYLIYLKASAAVLS